LFIRLHLRAAVYRSQTGAKDPLRVSKWCGMKEARLSVQAPLSKGAVNPQASDMAALWPGLARTR